LLTIKKYILIDGFPRNQENLEGWENASKGIAETLAVLYLECSFVSIDIFRVKK
jgi:hypothetical protein